MVLQLAAALLTVLVTMLAFLLVAVLAISLIVSVIMSLIGGFLDRAGHRTWTAAVHYGRHDGSLFCRAGRERDSGLYRGSTGDCRIRIWVIWARRRQWAGTLPAGIRV